MKSYNQLYWIWYAFPLNIVTNIRLTASIGVIGACEDQDDYDLRNQFSTNFLGTLHIIQLSLPHFRSQNHGRYLVFSSTAGALGVPGLGPYCATKYAVEGLIESMLYEVDVFNIKATLVEPGHVRLDEPDDGPVPAGTLNHTIAGIGGAGPPPPKRYGHFWVKPAPSAPYATLTSPAGHAKRMVQWLNDRQPVSAVKSAELVWQLGHCSYPPLRLLLGSYAVESIRDRLRSIIEEVCVFFGRYDSANTDFADRRLEAPLLSRYNTRRCPHTRKRGWRLGRGRKRIKQDILHFTIYASHLYVTLT
jgi:hypothetical protein